MKNEKMNEEEFIEELKKKFRAEPEPSFPGEEDLRFLDERNKLEEETAWDFEAYVNNYDQLKEYGLDEKLINQLEWLIVFYLENRKKEFRGSVFYGRFKGHEAVKRAFLEYERKMGLK